MVFQLREVKVRSTAEVQLPPRAVEEVEPKIDKTPRHRTAIDDNVELWKMQAPRPYDDRGQLFTEAIFLTRISGEVDLPVQGIHQVELTSYDVVPRRRGGILKIG